MQTADSSVVCHTARRPACPALSLRSSREDLHPTMHTLCAFEAFALKAIARSVASGCSGVRAVLVGSRPATRRQPCVGGADAPSLGGKVGQGSGYMKSPHHPSLTAPASTGQGSTSHNAQSHVGGGLELFPLSSFGFSAPSGSDSSDPATELHRRSVPASRAVGCQQGLEGLGTVGSGKTISGSADSSVGQILTREHAPHPNSVSPANPVSTQLGESAVVSGRCGFAQYRYASVACVAAQELRSSRRGSSDPGRS